MKIAVWPNGHWCEHLDAGATMRQQNLSDDFAVFTVDSEEAAERVAANIEAGRSPLAA